MPNVLNRGAAWLASKRTAHATEAVEYRSGATTAPVQATIGKSLFRINDEAGASLVVRTVDFLVAAADLPDDPQPGDSIVHAGREFEVRQPGGEPCWRWSDSFGRTRRIHTQDMGPAP